eukprot:scaffold4595_cov415-Prasinococcus_capsulatus_cf.AAC.12
MACWYKAPRYLKVGNSHNCGHKQAHCYTPRSRTMQCVWATKVSTTHLDALVQVGNQKYRVLCVIGDAGHRQTAGHLLGHVTLFRMGMHALHTLALCAPHLEEAIEVATN